MKKPLKDRPFATKIIGKTLTQQHHTSSCDINKIMDKFSKTGELPVSHGGKPLYGDFSNVPDYQTSLSLVLKAEAQFAGLPARIRDRFHNSPSEFLAFTGDDKNKTEMIAMGIHFDPKTQNADGTPKRKPTPPVSAAAPAVADPAAAPPAQPKKPKA